MPDLAIRSRDSDLKSAPDDSSSTAALFVPSRPSSMRSRASAILCLCGLGVAACATVFAFLGTGLSLLVTHSLEAARPEPLPAIIASDASPSSGRGPADKSFATSMQESSQTSPDRTQSRPTPTRETTAYSAIPGQHTTSPPEQTSVAAVPPRPTQSVPSAPAPPAPEHRPTDADAASVAARSETALSMPKGRDAAAQSVVVAPLPAPEIKALLLRGDAAFRRGDITSARLLYLRAYEAGEGRGALGLGASYDPVFLNRFRLWTQLADPDAARAWYSRARELGASEAKLRLERLAAKPHR